MMQTTLQKEGSSSPTAGRKHSQPKDAFDPYQPNTGVLGKTNKLPISTKIATKNQVGLLKKTSYVPMGQ